MNNEHNVKDEIFKNSYFAENLARITSVEEFDPQIFEFEKENLEGYLDLLIEQSCNLAKIKERDILTKEDILLINYKLTGIMEHIDNSGKTINKAIKHEEVNRIQTQEHKKRIDLTKEENKLINE